MTDTASWIAGLMRANSDALGFVPLPTLEHQYIQAGRYILQRDERGCRVGYLLHGAARAGCPLVITQHCIDGDHRLHGYGDVALRTLIQRATQAGASSIRLRCALDNESLAFWQAEGFVLADIIPGGQARQRQIVRLWLPLDLPLFKEAAA